MLLRPYSNLEDPSTTPDTAQRQHLQTHSPRTGLCVFLPTTILWEHVFLVTLFFVFCLCVCEIFMSVVYVNARACTRACVVSAILNQNQGAKSSLQAMHERSQGCVIFVCGCAAAVDFLCYGSACSDSTCCVPCRRLTS